ncbi:phospholipase A2 [Saccharopolyspora hirsuta]|uniref:phospholipase A2 n=1 Tax=Saccharopolyspora hirsuta TaxID=1837 RepID=UPI00332A504D
MRRNKKALTTALKSVSLAALAGVALVAPASAAEDRSETTASPAAVIDEANRIMNLPYDQFNREPHNAPFDWNNDGCSGPGPVEWNAVFHLACTQHDFGYRNYGGQGGLKLSVTRETKNWIDGRFRDEMVRICSGTPDPVTCSGMAQTYYLAVQNGGDSSFF